MSRDIRIAVAYLGWLATLALVCSLAPGQSVTNMVDCPGRILRSC